LPVAILKPTTPASATTDIYYIHADHLGTPRKITRPNDNRVVWSWESEAFGNSLPDQNPSGLGTFVFNLRFPGQYYDAETGLHYNMERYYNSKTGRYDQSDRIGLRGGINTYAYVGGNPVNLTDPTGNCPLCRLLIALGSVALDIYNLQTAGVDGVPTGTTGKVCPVANPVSNTLARVVPKGLNPTTLGKAGDLDVFVTNASELKGLSNAQIADKLATPEVPGGFNVIEFPSSSVDGIASPVFRINNGFVGGGQTAGGAAEFVIPNGPIPTGATQWIPH